MGLLQDIQRKIKAKESEIADIEEEIRSLVIKKAAAKAYISGLQDILPRVQRDEAPAETKAAEFRKGSAPGVVRDMLEKAGTPLHVDVILERMGKAGDKKAKLALVGTLARYARQKVGFKKAAPNTYTLIGEPQNGTPQEQMPIAEETEEELPEGFGK